MPATPLTHLPPHAPRSAYEAQAADLYQAWSTGAPEAIDLFHRLHPRFRDPKVAWKPADIDPDEVRRADLTIDDARTAVARGYDFRDWPALEAHVAACADPDGPAARFEAAVEAVITGDVAALRDLLARDPDLVRARSTRVTCFDPPEHRATLLHYVAANGVENFRQRSPANAVDVATTLLGAGADPDAVAYMYGGECSTMSMLVSSSPPADAGVQVALVHALADHGASVNPVGLGPWNSPLMTALVFGFVDAADALVRRGASIDSLAAAAGLGRADDVRMLLPTSDAVDRHRALALAAQNGQTEATGVLLDAGEDPNRFNPDGFHSHATPLHQAALAGYDDVVRLLVDRGARLDVRDGIWNASPLGWALHGEREQTAAYLRGRGAEE